MTHTSKRRLILGAIALFALVVFGVLFMSHHNSRARSANQSQVEALNDALKNGLITQSQYDAEIKKLQTQDHPQTEP
jgi:cell division protein FtsB